MRGCLERRRGLGGRRRKGRERRRRGERERSGMIETHYSFVKENQAGNFRELSGFDASTLLCL